MYKELIDRAIKAREHAYVPYSSFKVGAALLTKGGKIYEGANIESASFSLTNCAERTAFFKAVYDGEREFEAIAIVGGKDELVFCPPCGACREVMNEFCKGDFKIILLDKGEEKIYRLDEIMPLRFNL